MSNTAFENSLAALLLIKDQRVWSLIVTLFGDMAQAEGEVICGSVLSAVAAKLRLKPEATRVALHRLRKDGWISSEKSGRHSFHKLTEFGQSQSSKVSGKIYAVRGNLADDWHVLIAAPMAKAAVSGYVAARLEDGYVALRPGVFVKQGPLRDGQQGLCLAGNNTPIPAWIKAEVYPPKMQDSYAILCKTLLVVNQNLRAPSELSALEIIALRVLIVHHWRKLALRSPDLPDGFFPDDWRGAMCRKLVHEVLEKLPRPVLASVASV